MDKLYDASGNELIVGSSSSSTIPDIGQNLRIAEYDKAFTSSSPIATPKDAEGYCITDWYDVAIYAGRYLCMCFPNAESGHDGKVWVMFNGVTYGTYRYMQYVEYGPSMGEESRNFIASHAPYNKARFTLKTQYLDYCYAYWSDTGEILFAGKLSKYYGYTHVDHLTDGLSVEKAQTGVMTAPDARYPNLTAERIAKIKADCAAWAADVGNRYDRIPFILTTDQHGIDDAAADTYRLLTDIVDWSKPVKLVNLGDTCSDSYSSSALKAYTNAVKGVPVERRIAIAGNHDTYRCDGMMKFAGDQHNLVQHFGRQTGGMRLRSNYGYGTILDGATNIKYLVINNDAFTGDYTGSDNIAAQNIDSTQWDFIVRELGKDDGYDIIVLSHCPINNTMTNRDGQSHTDWVFLPTASEVTALQAMLSARKSKTSGSFTDHDGATHTYDFTGLKSDILISFHGHSHFEGMALNGTVPQLDFGRLSGGYVYFGYFNRESGTAKLWNCVDEEPWEIDWATE